MLKTFIEELFIYPIKSLPGLAVSLLTIEALGVKDDRAFVLVNANGRFISQRSHPMLATFKLADNLASWTITASTGESVSLPKQGCSKNAMQASVWKDDVTAYEVDPSISHWFSQQLNETVYLVRFDDTGSRQVEQKGHTGHFAFADGYPLLVCNSNTLKEVNRESPTQLSMQRFRPNIVVALPAEEEYRTNCLRFDHGGELHLVETCVRCNIPAIDLQTATFERTIHDYLKGALDQDGKPVFGMNAIATQLSVLSLGDQCTAL